MLRLVHEMLCFSLGMFRAFEHDLGLNIQFGNFSEGCGCFLLMRSSSELFLSNVSLLE